MGGTKHLLALTIAGLVAGGFVAAAVAADSTASATRVKTVWCKTEGGQGKKPPAFVEALGGSRYRAYYFSGATADSVWVVAPSGWICVGGSDAQGTFVEARSGGLGDQPTVRGVVLKRGRKSSNVSGPFTAQSEGASQEVKVTDYFGINWAWWFPNRKRSAELGCYWSRPNVCTAAYASFDSLARTLR